MPIDATRAQTRQLVTARAQIVEVLAAEQYRWAHLPGAVNVPLGQLADRTGELDRSRPVLVYCNDTL
jgi:rhodanese-related sulfurtransferase